MVSIIIPVYNCEKYLSKCVNSILRQTYKNVEVLLVNDGSTDNSLNVCNSFNDKRIKVINKTNGGASSARNKGLDVAKGEYIMFVDSDDFVSENIVEVLLKNLKKYDADVSICPCFILKDKNDVVNNGVSNEKIFVYNNIELNLHMKNLDEGNVGDVVWGKLFKKELFENLRFTEGMINEDAVLLHELYYNCKKGVLTNQKLYNYCVFDNNSVSRQKYSYKHLDNLKAYELRIKFFKDKNEMLYINALKDYNTNCAFNYYLVSVYLKDKLELKKMKKNMNNNYKIIKNSKYLTKKNKVKSYFQVHVPFIYGMALNMNLKRKELKQKNENKSRNKKFSKVN